MIEVKNIEKSFGESKVLKGISTVFETGKTNLIIGQSGSGKQFCSKVCLVFSRQTQEQSNLTAEFTPHFLQMKNENYEQKSEWFFKEVRYLTQ